jgi:cytochrome subunit of sulfide dehydrogenase
MPRVLILLALAAGAAQAQPTAEQLQVRTLAAACAQCHGTAGKPIPGSVLPGLAGMPADYLDAQMKAFKSGARPATVMHQIAKGYSDAQIAALAAYFNAQKN